MQIAYVMNSFAIVRAKKLCLTKSSSQRSYNQNRHQRMHVSQLSHSGWSHRQYRDNPSACIVSCGLVVSSYIRPLAKNRKKQEKVYLCVSTTVIKDSRCTGLCPSNFEKFNQNGVLWYVHQSAEEGRYIST